MRRVVITGQGAISSLGKNIQQHHYSLANGSSGIKPLQISGADLLAVKIGASVPNYNGEDYFPKVKLSLYDKHTQLALIAANEAIENSGLEITDSNNKNFGVILGNSGAGLSTIEENYRNVFLNEKKRLHPFIVPKLMGNAASSQISINFNIKGPSFTISSACSSSNHAIGQAFKIIQSGALDLIISGGSESMLCFGGLKAWESLRVMSDTGCRPFCLTRDGMVQGEGAAIFVFETLEHAKKRRANILAEVIGFSMTSDAAEVVAPDLEGAKRAIEAALIDGKLDCSDVDYINAHGTGTKLNDKIECTAIKQVFSRVQNLPLISSSKSMHGHLIGGAGAIELVTCIMAIQKGVVAPTINYNEKDPDCNLDVVANVAREKRVNVVMSNAFAFGGTNSVLILKRF